MTSPPHPAPRRQNSAVSSASSGNRTVRATSRSGRSSSSATAKGNNNSGLFARFRGKSQDRPNDHLDSSDDEEDGISDLDDNDNNNDKDSISEIGSPTPRSGEHLHPDADYVDDAQEMVAGPSDYWRRPMPPRSPEPADLPPPDWRKLSEQPFDPTTIEDGPSDQYWGPTSPVLAPPPLSRAGASYTDGSSLDSQALVVKEQGFDNAEYERRLRDVLSHENEAADGDVGSPTPSGAGFPWHPSESPNLAQGGYDEGYREVLGGEEKAYTENGPGDEEFGVLDFPQRDDGSDRTPSTVSTSLSKVKDGRPSLAAFTPSPGKRASFVHPSVSRLRSHMRTSSSTTQQSLRHPNLAHLRTPSHFSQISAAQSEVMSVGNVSGLLVESHSPHRPAQAVAVGQTPAFTFHPLRRLSAHLFSRTTSGASSPARPPPSRQTSFIPGIPGQNPKGDNIELGKPSVMDIRGMVAVGTDRGYVVVYTFAQEVKHVLGNEGSVTPVTAVTISADETYIAVGRASGNVHLYDLSNPTKAARTTMALTLRQVLSGRREGHLQGSRILHIGFVGTRHTSVVTGDEHGRAFWWSLGKVMGVESNDVVRMLGSYPETDQEAPTYPSKRPTTLFAALPLPVGETPHATDAFSLSALLTPSKLVIVGMKPSAKTWFRKMRDAAGGEYGCLTGCASWLRSGEVDIEFPSDPVLAYSWGKAVRFLRIRTTQKGKDLALDLVEGRSWEASDFVRALQWYDPNHLLLITSSELVLLDVRSMAPIETTALQTRLLTNNDFYSGLAPRANATAPDALASSVRTHRGKLFLLTKTNLQVGTLLHWNDRILARVHQGDFLGAIQVAVTYFENRATGNVINLPLNEDERKSVVGRRIRELIHASLEWAFSPDRMTDDTHYSADGRGVDLTGLFEGLATSCIEACLSTQDMDFLFDEAYEHYSQVGIQAIFLHILEPFIFSGRIRQVPPNIIQALITMHDSKGEYGLAESIIWHVDPTSLDINQAITLCEAHGLWDAMIHVYTRAMQDYVAPIVKLISVVRNIQHHRLNRPSLVGDRAEGDAENMAPDAYKLYAYIESILSGLSYPSGEPLPTADANYARTEVYSFIFQGRTVAWPAGGDLVLTSDSVEPPYPYLSLLLRFDTEAFLHAMDIAFEDSYLNDTAGAINRQSIVNLMLDVMDPEYFHPGDITFLHIFVARNLPKYPQFLFIPPSTLHRILVSLASDQDQSTREDRQLAAEYLLSAYTPHDIDAMLALFEQAGFFRILRAAYRREGKWAQLISTLLRDPDSDEEVFASLDEIIRTASASSEVTRGVLDALPQLFDLGVRQTAVLLDRDLPTCHARAIEMLGKAPHKQMAYLRCLLEPDMEESGTIVPSKHVDMPGRHLYVSLLCQNDPEHVVSFLDARGPAFFDVVRLAKECENAHIYEAQIWALDRQGNTRATFDTIGDVLRTQGGDLAEAMVSNEAGDLHLSLQTIQSVSRMAVRLCQEHTSTRRPGEEVEDMWLGVLHEIIELVHSASALKTASNEVGSLDMVVMDTLRSLVQETLASLVSSSSHTLSFPRLFKRLVDASTSNSKASKKGRAYSEFRTILTGMLDSYRAEGEMLGMTTRLVETDLFESLADLTLRRKKGWRPVPASITGGNCAVCGESVEGLGVGISIMGSGKVVHPHCTRKSGD